MSPNDYEPLPEEQIPTDVPPRRRGFAEGPGRWVLIGTVIAVVTGIIVISLVSQTRLGRDQVLAYTLETLGGRLNGTLTIERLDGNLIGGARAYDLALVDEDGTPLALADSAFIRYKLATFLGGDIVINRLDVFDAELHIFRLPGDTLWNYQKVLENPSPDPSADPNATLIESLFVNRTRIQIRAPVEPDERLSEAQQQAALQEMLQDTARYMIEEVPGGYMQTQLIDVEQGELAELYIGGEARGGTYLEVVDGVAEIRLWRDPPLQIRGVTASVHLDEGILNYEAPRIELPNSSGESVGRVDLSGDRPLYDVYISTPTFSIADLRFLYPWLPDDPDAGSGSARLWVEDIPDGLMVVARELDFEMPQTHITGDFGLVTNPVDESLRFVDVALEAEPLRVESVEQLLPEDLPVEGLVIAGATIEGRS